MSDTKRDMNDEKAKAARDLARIQATPEGLKKLLRPIKDVVFDMPRDQAALWVLEKPEEEVAYLDVLRFGACDFRETENAHTMAAPVGWPRYMGEEFERAGVKLAFQNLFVWHFGDFPDEATMLKRRRKRRGRPDVIIVQTGGFPAVRHIFGFNIWSFLARENLGRRLGPLMHPIWRVMDVFLRAFGRPAAWHGPEPELEDFIAQLQRVWPGVPIEFWKQNDPVLEGFWVRSVADRLIEESTPVLERLDVPMLEAAPIPEVMALRGANGLNFNERGSRAVGTYYALHLLARYRHLAKTPSQRKAEAAAEAAAAPSEPAKALEPAATDAPAPATPEPSA